MVAQENGPSFASILTILSIVMYTGGFLRIEVEFNKQKDKINELEKVVKLIPYKLKTERKNFKKRMVTPTFYGIKWKWQTYSVCH